MAEPSQIERLAERRRHLVSRSQELRSQIGRDVEGLRPVFTWMERGAFFARSLRSTWPFVGGLAAFVATRKSGSWFRKAGKLWSWWRLGKKAAEIWRSFSPK